MRLLSKVMLSLSVAVTAAGVALGQGFPFQIGGAPPDPASLMRNPSIQKELKLTEEQIKKMPDAVLKALAEVLDKDQFKRLKQIHLQLRGVDAYTDPEVQRSLKMTAEQKTTIEKIVGKANEEIRDLMKGGLGNPRELLEKIGTLRKDTVERVTDILTVQQRRLWVEMIGDEFQMPRVKKDGK